MLEIRRPRRTLMREDVRIVKVKVVNDVGIVKRLLGEQFI